MWVTRVLYTYSKGAQTSDGYSHVMWLVTTIQSRVDWYFNTSWCYVTDTWHPPPTLTQHLLPALWTTAHGVNCGCYQPMMIQWPHHTSQPHKQLFMGGLQVAQWWHLSAAAGMTGDARTSNNGDRQHTQHHKQLLMGWNTGRTMANGVLDEGHSTHPGTSASHCS